jgi:hypothetical protein
MFASFDNTFLIDATTLDERNYSRNSTLASYVQLLDADAIQRKPLASSEIVS